MSKPATDEDAYQALFQNKNINTEFYPLPLTEERSENLSLAEQILRLRQEKANDTSDGEEYWPKNSFLHLATRSDYYDVEIIRILLQWPGTKPEDINAKNIFGETPLALAVGTSRIKVVKLIVENFLEKTGVSKEAREEFFEEINNVLLNLNPNDKIKEFLTTALNQKENNKQEEAEKFTTTAKRVSDIERPRSSVQPIPRRTSSLMVPKLDLSFSEEKKDLETAKSKKTAEPPKKSKYLGCLSFNWR